MWGRAFGKPIVLMDTPIPAGWTDNQERLLERGAVVCWQLSGDMGRGLARIEGEIAATSGFLVSA